MKSPTDTHLLLCVGGCAATAASRACIIISAATSSPRRPRSTQCRSELFARWRTGFAPLSCISRDAASARRGSEPASVTSLSKPVVAARHSRMWRSTCVQATWREIESALNSRANRTARHAREPGLSPAFSSGLPFNSFCFANSKSSSSFRNWS